MKGRGKEVKREKRVSYKTVNRVSLSKIVAGRVAMLLLCKYL